MSTYRFVTHVKAAWKRNRPYGISGRQWKKLYKAKRRHNRANPMRKAEIASRWKAHISRITGVGYDSY